MARCLRCAAGIAFALVVANQVQAQARFTRLMTGAIATDADNSQEAVWFDYDQDGDLDLLVINSNARNALYRNNGFSSFERVEAGALTADADRWTGAACADFNTDGRLDVVATRVSGSPVVFLQQADHTFVAAHLPVLEALAGSYQSVSVGDIDRDGAVDFALAGAEGQPCVFWGYPFGDFWRLPALDGFATARPVAWAWGDYDGDRLPDLYGATPGGAAPLLLHNFHGISFQADATGPVATEDGRSVAAAWADYDNDGDIDLLVVNNSGLPAEPTAMFLYRNEGDGTFTRVPDAAFPPAARLASGAAWGDYDNDGFLDLYIACSATASDLLYHNNGDGTFSVVNDQPGLQGLVNSQGESTTASWVDYDGDGRLDLSVGNSPGPQFLFHNTTEPAGNYLGVLCLKPGGGEVFGATVRATISNGTTSLTMRRDLWGGSPHCPEPLRAHFGLGAATNVARLRIEWPSGWVQERANVPANQWLAVEQFMPEMEFSGLFLPAGGHGAFRVSVGTNACTFQWFHQGVKLEGETKPYLAFKTVSSDQAGDYTVTVRRGDDTVELYTYLVVVTTLGDGLVADYPLDGDGRDVSPNHIEAGLGGSVLGPLPAPDRLGQASGAVALNGTGDFIFIPNTPIWALGNKEFTISFWANPAVLTNKVPLLTFFGDLQGTNSVMRLEMSPEDYGVAEWTLSSATTNYVLRTGIAVSAGQWTHFVLHKTADELRLFTDYSNTGGPEEMPEPISSSPAPIVLGRGLGDVWFNGRFDSFKMWNRALHIEEVLALHQGERPLWLGIDEQPEGGIFGPGSEVRIRVKAEGVGELSYQWLRNGQAMSGATNSVLALRQVRVTDTADYSVIVRGLFGAVTSVVANVTVRWPLQFTVASMEDFPAILGNGASVADFDGDGLEDVLLASGTRAEGSALLRNLGGGRFTNIIEQAFGGMPHWIEFGAWGDYDNDGRPDLFLCRDASMGTNALYHNLGGGRFEDVSALSGAGERVSSEHAAWIDYNRDGYLDLFVCTMDDGGNRLYRNLGDGTFARVLGVPAFDRPGKSWGAAWGDYDSDGWPDVAVKGAHSEAFPTNQFITLYHNENGAGFTRVADFPVPDEPQSGFGVAWSDSDNDGKLDLLMVGAFWEPVYLYRNRGTAGFALVDVGRMSRDRVNAYAGIWADLNNDGWSDTFITGFYETANRLFFGSPDGSFAGNPEFFPVLGQDHDRGAAAADFNGDGQLDIVLASEAGFTNRLLLNRGNDAAWLRVKLVGRLSNRDAVGAVVRATAVIGDRRVTQMRQIETTAGYQSQGSLVAHFGLGDATNVSELSIEWPSGLRSTFHDITSSRLHSISERSTLQPAIQGRGRVTVSPNVPDYWLGQPITLLGVPDRWSEFVQWSDGATENPRQILFSDRDPPVAVFRDTTPLETVDAGGQPILIPLGTPRIYIEDEFHFGGSVEFLATNAVRVRMESSLQDAQIFYTLDGSVADVGGEPYTGLFTLSPSLTPVVINAIAYDPESREYPTDPVVVRARALLLSTSVSGQGSVVLDPQGPYLSNTVVSVSAVAGAGWTFDHWEGALDGANPSRQLVVQSDGTVRAVFLPTFNLTTRVLGGGSLALSPPSGPYKSNTLVTLAAAPIEGWAFDHWTGDATGTNVSTSVAMSQARDVSAVFIRTYSLAVSTTGGGSVAFSPSGAPAVYRSNDVVTLTATAANGWSFMGWIGDVEPAQAVSAVMPVAMDRDRVIRGVFGTTLTTSPNASGTIVREPASGPYAFGSTVRLTAVPNAGKYFNNWGGAAAGQSVSPLNFSVTNATQTVSAVFGSLQANQFALNVSIEGGGSVTRSPFYARYTNGTSVLLTAVADDLWSFSEWGGDAAGQGNPATLAMSATRNVTARFVSPPAIVEQPADLALGVGASGALTVMAASGVAPAYRWHFKDALLPGATNPAIRFDPMTADRAGSYFVIITNLYGAVTSRVAQVVISGANLRPLAQSRVVSTLEDVPVEITLAGSDPDHDALAFRVVAPPLSGVLGGTPPNLIFTPATNSTGPVQFNFVANDGQLDSDPATVTININPVNDAPVLPVQATRTIAELTALVVTNNASDVDSPQNTLHYALQSAPAGASIDTSGVIRWTPTEAQGPNTYQFITVVTDDGAPPLSSTNEFSVVVTEVNSAPSLAPVADQTVAAGGVLRVLLAGSDPDAPANGLLYGRVSGPAGLVVNPATGELVWSVPSTAAGTTNDVVVRVADDGSPPLNADRAFRVVVSPNAAPVADAIADRTIDEGVLFTLSIPAHDPDGSPDSLRFSLDPGAPEGMAIGAASGVLTWTPTEAQGPSTNPVIVRVTDAGSPPASSIVSFRINVREVNTAPTLDGIAAQEVDPLATLQIQLSGHDADFPANTLSYALVSGPEAASVNPSTGVFAWTPTAQQAGMTVAALVQVTDNGLPPMQATQAFPIKVSGCAPGSMRVLIDGACYSADSHVVVTNSAELRIVPAFERSLVFYTLDNTVPGDHSDEFPVQGISLTTSVVVRARAFDLASGDMQEAGPVFVDLVHAWRLMALTSGGGRVVVNPARTPSTNASGVLYGPYAGDSMVELSAQPSPGWSFMRWSRAAAAGGSASPWPIVLRGESEVEAVFGTRILLTNLVNGSVRLNPAADPYAYGSSVRVTAEPAPGYYHRSWVGVGTPATPAPFDLVLTNPEPRISALFLPLGNNQVTLSVLTEGPGSVTVDPLLNVYTNGQSVTLSATIASPANPFLGWSGLTNATANPLSLKLAGSQTNFVLTARFRTNALPFWFEPPAYAVPESNGVVTLTAHRGTQSPQSVGFRTAAGTASAVDADGWGDYWGTNGALVFAQGAATASLSVALRDNHSSQSDRAFLVELFDPGETNTVWSSAAITILEDDPPSTDCSVFERRVDGGQVTNATLRVVLAPGAPAMRWRLGHEHVWRGSGESVPLVAGDYDLRFKPVTGYEPPGWGTSGFATRVVRVVAGLNQVTNGYTEIAAQGLPNGIDVLVYPAELRGIAQWHLVGEVAWQSGERLSVPIGEHLVEFSPVDGYVAPLPQTVVVGPSGVQSIAVEYAPASVESVQAHSLVELVSADVSRSPYRFMGQIVGRKDSFGSGAAVRERVVLTAGHVVYDNKALANRSGVRWLHMGQGTGRDASLQPRGWVLWTGYSDPAGAPQSYTNQVAQESVRGLASLRTRDLDVAALYFLTPAARGWYSGYLVSGPTSCATNAWLETTQSKLLVGFPNVGTNFGRMMELAPRTNALTRMSNADYTAQRVYGSSGFASFGGNSGAPLCVDAGNGVYYPAAVYLGVTDNRGIFAVIDSAVVAAIIRQADYLADTGRSHDGSGGPIEAPLEFLGGLGAVTVQLSPPGAVAAGARWSLAGIGGPYTNSQTIPFVPPGNYQVTFAPAAGYRTPADQAVMVWPDQTAPLLVAYQIGSVVPARVASWSLNSGQLELSVTGSVGATWILEASTNLLDPVRYGFRPVQTNALDATGRWTVRDTNAANIPSRYFRLKMGP